MTNFLGVKWKSSDKDNTIRCFKTDAMSNLCLLVINSKDVNSFLINKNNSYFRSNKSKVYVNGAFVNKDELNKDNVEEIALNFSELTMIDVKLKGYKRTKKVNNSTDLVEVNNTCC